MKKLALYALVIGISSTSFGQQENKGGNLTGNVESIFQYLVTDSIIKANQPASKGLINSYMNVYYTQGNFKAGMRIESYMPGIQGYPANFDGTGIGMRYVGYTNDLIDITAGSFYEQFGSGMALRAYEDRALGYDNMLDGIRLIVRPHDGVTLKGVYGLQRLAFLEGKIVHSDGIVRGIDGEVNLNSAIKKLKEAKLDITLGASFVSKFQKDDNEDLILPENVGVYGGRAAFRYGKFTLDGEYTIKEQDPSTDNLYIYNYGHAALINFGYSTKGLGIVFSAKSVNNMSYRSDRTEELQNVLINYLPSINKVHTYNLVASLYPYATQPLGEIAYQAEAVYTIKRKTKLGGKYGVTLNGNVSLAYLPKDFNEYNNIDDLDSTREAYTSGVFDMSDSLLWSDINFSIYKKFSKKFNLKLSYFNIILNNDVGKVTNDASGEIRTHIGVVEIGYKFNRKHSLRAELQALIIEDDSHGDISDRGNWATVLVEYNVSPHWFFSIMDQWNMPNSKLSNIYPTSDDFDPVKSGVHYLYYSAGYIEGATRFTVGYGRQRAGLFCVGGVCRFVPASNGLTFSFTHSF